MLQLQNKNFLSNKVQHYSSLMTALAMDSVRI
jgi:hypothetical protein